MPNLASPLKWLMYIVCVSIALPLQFVMIGGTLPAQTGLFTGLAFVLSGALLSLAHATPSELAQTVQDLLAPKAQADWESRYPMNRKILATLGNYIWLGGISGSSLLLIYLLSNLDTLSTLYSQSVDALLPLILALLLHTFVLAPLHMHLHCQALKKGLRPETLS